MSHYEERLQADIESIRHRVAEVASRVEKAQKRAASALLTGNRELAYETILGDLPINREVRAIDSACHAFVARHLPSAGILRFISSVLRLDIELERIGDYAVTICREAVQLSAPPVGVVARDLEMLADQGRRVLRQAMRSWNESNAELARGTLGMVKQATGTSDKVFEELLQAGQEEDRPLSDHFSLLLIFNRFNRVVAQAKNICEETLFAATGETKAPKRYRILFVDETNDCHSQLAEAVARKVFPESGRYASAGWAPAQDLETRCRLFMDKHGLDVSRLQPSGLALSHEELARFHVIVSLGDDVRPHLQSIPFHTSVLEWDAGPSVAGLDQERAERLLEESYKEIASKVRELMEILRGKEAS